MNEELFLKKLRKKKQN